MSVEVGQRLQVEVYPHGGWWKASNGQTGQVPTSEARKGPLAAVAMVANRFGMDGWELVEVVSQPQQHLLAVIRASLRYGRRGVACAALRAVIVVQVIRC
jgi:hypothetical protein